MLRLYPWLKLTSLKILAFPIQNTLSKSSPGDGGSLSLSFPEEKGE